MSILFLNGSPNKNGNTAALARTLLSGKDYDTLTLTDYKIYSYGQSYPDDQFGEVLTRIKAADTIVIGAPMYWHNLGGAVRDLLDRFYGPVQPGELRGKRLAFLFQGAAPEKWQLDAAEYTMSRFAGLYGMEYLGMATDAAGAKKLAGKI